MNLDWSIRLENGKLKFHGFGKQQIPIRKVGKGMVIGSPISPLSMIKGSR